jgi:tetratricopeptide (TPR) repeat protein
MWANYQSFSGNKQEAQAWFKQILGVKNSIYTYKGYIYFLFEHEDYQQIINIMQHMNDTFKHDIDIQRMYALSLLNTGKIKPADERIIALNIEYPHNTEIAFYAVNSYLRRQEFENALLTINNLLNNRPTRPNDFIFHFLKAQVYTRMNENRKAKEAVQDALKLHPGFDKGWLLLSVLTEEEGNLPEAIKNYTTFLGLSKEPQQEIEQHLLQLSLKQKMITDKTPSLLINKVA